MQLLSILFSSGCLICAAQVSQSRNPVVAVMSLVLLFANAAGLLLLQGIEFFAILMVIVYIGALSVMFLFVVMLLNIKLTEIVSYQRATYYTVAQSLCFWLLAILLTARWNSSENELQEPFKLFGSLSGEDSLLISVGVRLYTELFDLLILAALILLVAMIGAVVLALKKQPKAYNSLQIQTGSLNEAKQTYTSQRDFQLLVNTIES